MSLRPLSAADADAIVDGVGNYDVSRWLSVVPFPYSSEDAEAFLASPAAEPRRTWAICDPDLVGIISIGEEMGFWLARRVWGRGYLPEAGQLVIDAAFADRTRRRLMASHMMGNDRSARVLEKLGFHAIGYDVRFFRALEQDATVRVMEMTRPDWRRARRGASAAGRSS